MVGGAFISLFKGTAKEWSEDKASRHAAALSYYTIFSIAPMLIIAIAVAGLVFGQDAAREQILGEVGGLVGQGGSEAVKAMVEGASQPKEGLIATVLGVAALLFGASGVFGQLQDSMNTIWEVRSKPGTGVLGFLKARFTSFSMVLVIAFLLLVSLVLSAGLAALGKFLGGFLGEAGILLRVVDLAVSLGVVTLLFALMYKVLPDAKIRWGDVWVGALFTAGLFTIGRYLIGLYLGRSAVGSAYGAAGSLVIILLWIYYSSQILFFGAEFTQVYASRKGSRVVPDEDAEAVAKPTPVPGKPALVPGATKGRGAGTPEETRPDRSQDAHTEPGWRRREREERVEPVPARLSASPKDTRARAAEDLAPRASHPSGVRRSFGLVRKRRSLGAAALAMSLAYVTGEAALRSLRLLFKSPRRA